MIKNKNNNNVMLITESKEITNAIKLIFQNAKWIRCAVAYWGKGACETILKNLRTKDIVIIADVFSGGCNPKEIEKLIKKFPNKILFNNLLHAKVYLSNLGVIVGSANASTNGMNFEGSDSHSLNEAVIFSKDKNIINDASIWFDKIAEHAKDDIVEKKHLDEIRDNFSQRKKGKNIKKQFLDSAEAGDYNDELIYIVVGEKIPDNSSIIHNAVSVRKKASRKHPNLINTKDTDWYYDVSRKFPYGKQVFGFIKSNNIEIDQNGKWEILEEKFKQKQNGDKYYTFCNPIESLPNHQNDILKILNKLMELGKLPSDGEIVFKIEKLGLKCVLPVN